MYIGEKRKKRKRERKKKGNEKKKRRKKTMKKKNNKISVAQKTKGAKTISHKKINSARDLYSRTSSMKYLEAALV